LAVRPLLLIASPFLEWANSPSTLPLRLLRGWNFRHDHLTVEVFG
jgi:hypothetical protein